MIRVIVVADSGPVMATVTRALGGISHVEIVGYASGRVQVGAMVRSLSPDVVLIDEMCWSGLALTRVAEVRKVAPGTVVVGLVEHPDAGWIVEGLRAGAAAVVPRDMDAATLDRVLTEALQARTRLIETSEPEERAGQMRPDRRAAA
jgi:DNA-binding NarL/FixJ family response regulator